MKTQVILMSMMSLALSSSMFATTTISHDPISGFVRGTGHVLSDIGHGVTHLGGKVVHGTKEVVHGTGKVVDHSVRSTDRAVKKVVH